jgi:hypothetical protein
MKRIAPVAVQVVTRLGGALPIAISAGPDWEETAEQLDDLFLGDAEVWCAGLGARRPAPQRVSVREPERRAAQGLPPHAPPSAAVAAPHAAASGAHPLSQQPARAVSKR